MNKPALARQTRRNSSSLSHTDSRTLACRVPFDGGNETHYHFLMQREPTSVLISPSSTPSPAPASRTAIVRRVTSHDLLGASGQLVITHDGREYRLRVTQNNKLILTA